VNSSTTRILSAAALIAVLVLTVWHLPPIATVVLASLVALVGAWEVAGLSSHVGAPVSARFVGPLAAVLCFVSAVGLSIGPTPRIELVPILVLALVLAVGILTLAGGSPGPDSLPRAAIAVMAPIYVGLPLGAIARVRLLYGPEVVGVLALLVIVSDSAQYFVGRALGRRKLAPQISPGKTLEGALGGVVITAIAGATLAARWVPGLTVPSGALLGLLVAAFGIVGDLFESLLKRGAGVKDSSALIPGHGGVLDRIDSWLFAGPVYYVFLRYLS
jgi:phosphatidate cytidylyltransferase